MEIANTPSWSWVSPAAASPRRASSPVAGQVRATDLAPADRIGPAAAELRALGVELELGGHRPESFTGRS